MQGDTWTTGNVTANNALTVVNVAQFQQSVLVNNTFTVGNLVNLRNNVFIQGDTWTTGNVTANNALTVSNLAQFKQSVLVNNNFTVGNATSLQGNVSVSGDAFFSANASITGAVTAVSMSAFNITASTSLTAPAATISGRITGNTSIFQNIQVANTVNTGNLFGTQLRITNAVAQSAILFAGTNANVVGINTSNPDPTYALDITGSVRATGDITASSDQRIKSNVQTLANALDIVSRLRGVSYTRNDQKQDGIGFIAQEVQNILPQVVRSATHDGMLSIAYGNMTGLLVEAIKQQQQQIQSLEKRIQALVESLGETSNISQ